MKRLILRISFWVFIAIAFLILFLASYSFYLIGDLNKKGGFEFNAVSQGRDLSTEIITLELGSFIHKKDIEVLYPFLENNSLIYPRFQDWFSRSIEDGSINQIQEEPGSQTLQVNSPTDFTIKMINDCDRVYCFQRKMNFSDIPSALWRGLIGVEDSRFLEHRGVDLRALFRALVADVKAMGFVQGGSTLTQQLVKNLFFTNEKTINRKIKEMLLSIYIEAKYEKEEILQAYFNEVIWGSLAGVRIKGVYGASLFYFSKNPSELTDYESSILSALLKGPYYYHPLKNLEGLKERTTLVYNKLRNDNYISKEDRTQWSDQEWITWKNDLKIKNTDYRYKAISAALKQKEFYDFYIWSTITGERLAELKKRKNLKEVDLASKVYIRDVLECTGPDEECEDFVYYSKKERNQEAAVKEERNQVGSILKPLVYQAFFKEKFKKEDIVSMEPITLNLLSGKWTPKEAAKVEEAYINLEEALKKSRNIPVIKLAQEYGFDQLEKDLDYYIPQMNRPLSEYPSQLLGALELSVMEISKIYHKFIQRECTAIENGDQDDDEAVLFMLSNPQETTIRRFLDPMMLTFQFFGKTGTSNYAHDNWFVGFNGRHLVTIWTGLEGVRGKESLLISGASAAYKIYEAYWLRSGKGFPEFNCPESLIQFSDDEQ